LPSGAEFKEVHDRLIPAMMYIPVVIKYVEKYCTPAEMGHKIRTYPKAVIDPKTITKM